MAVFDALVSTGLDVRDCRVPGYRGRGIDVRGTLWHHTASPAGSGDLPSLEVCQRGRPDLPGPLCQVLIGRAGTVAVITDGRANHAGAGAWPGISDGNGQLVGVEIENDGRGEPFTAGQLEVARRVGRALRRRFGHALDIGHKEWAPGRKIDPAFDMGAFRASLDSGDDMFGPDQNAKLDAIYTAVARRDYDGDGKLDTGWLADVVEGIRVQLDPRGEGTIRDALLTIRDELIAAVAAATIDVDVLAAKVAAKVGAGPVNLQVSGAELTAVVKGALKDALREGTGA